MVRKFCVNEKLEDCDEIKDKFFQELIYVFCYQGILRDCLIDYKFNDKSYIYKMFAEIILNDEKMFKNIQKYDKIIPVPISKKRNKDRGYNQSYLIAKFISRQTKLGLVNNCLVKTKNIVEQSKLNREQRLENIQNVYRLNNKEKLLNQKILLFDDVYTTGSTVNECCRVLQKANPSKIGVLVLAKD